MFQLDSSRWLMRVAISFIWPLQCLILSLAHSLINLTVIINDQSSADTNLLTRDENWNLVKNRIWTICLVRGAWIAEWYHTQLWTLVHWAMPCAISSNLGDNKLFFGPMLSTWFYLVHLIWYYYLSVKFVMWIVKPKIEIKRFFK